jgi:diguanylate cyclase (GGDEF)-like protein
MMGIAACIALNHDLKLVILAAILCVSGVWVSFKLYRRALGTNGAQTLGWIFLTAVCAGTSIWSTHFIAMLGYRADVPVTFDPVMTIVSLLIAMVGTGIGLALSISKINKFMPAIGGAVVGLAIAAMHFTGMFAYRADGFILWNQWYIVAALVLVIVFSAAAFESAHCNPFKRGMLLANILLCIAIVSLHFTAMTAFQVIPLGLTNGDIDSTAFEAMALSIAIACLIIAGAGLASYLIDGLNRSLSDENIRYLALHDQLTGLPNRTSYTHFVDIMLKQAANLKSNVAIIGIDLNRFKAINDTWGHSAGDKALKIIAERLQDLAGNNRFLARIGGDEFAAVKSFTDNKALHRFLTDIQAEIQKPMQIDGADITLESSIGVAIFPNDGMTYQTLVNNADLAMYRAKTESAQRICYYDQQLGDLVRSNRAMIDDLRSAIENEQLNLHYQVQTSIGTGEILSYEALLRWTHPQLGPISPATFIPLAEDSGLILQIGEWVLRRACTDAARWNPGYRIAVNISAVQLNQQDLPGLVHQILFETGLSPERLELELTETALVKDRSRSLNVIQRIKALGVKVALDDFGVGYSSLETLRVFPFDKIKLDRFFIESLAREPQCLAIVRAVLALGRSLNIPILAEGIETPEQRKILASEGCDEGQGFGLGRPIPNHQLEAAGGPRTIKESASAEVIAPDVDVRRSAMPTDIRRVS